MTSASAPRRRRAAQVTARVVPAISSVPSKVAQHGPGPAQRLGDNGHWRSRRAATAPSGWNCTNSRSLITGPGPGGDRDPVAWYDPAGLDVVPNACPEPPADSITTATGGDHPRRQRPSPPLRAAARPVDRAGGVSSRSSGPAGPALAAAAPRVARARRTDPRPVYSPRPDDPGPPGCSGRPCGPVRLVRIARVTQQQVERDRGGPGSRSRWPAARPVSSGALGAGRVVARGARSGGRCARLPAAGRASQAARQSPVSPPDRAGRAVRERRHHARLAQPGPGDERVRHVRGGGSPAPRARREPALCERRRPAHQVLGHHEDPAARARPARQRDGNPGRPGSDNDHIRHPAATRAASFRGGRNSRYRGLVKGVGLTGLGRSSSACRDRSRPAAIMPSTRGGARAATDGSTCTSV